MSGVFSFDSYDAALRKGDGYCELSINWNDNEGALKTLLEQHKPFKTENQFKVGYCKLDRIEIELALKTYIKEGHFKYERSPLLGDKDEDIQPNPYHGNLLMLNGIDKNAKKNIQHTLATLAGQIIHRED